MRFWFLYFFLATTAVAETSAPPPAVPEASRFQLGMSLQFLVPNRLPEFSISVPAYGPKVGWAIGKDVLSAELLYASQSNLRLSLIDIGYRWTMETPFFTSYLVAGLHYFHYSETHSFDVFGGNMGLGLMLTVAKNLHFQLGIKAYAQQKLMLAFGGGFSFLL